MAEPFEVQPLPPLYQQPSFAPVEPDKSPIADLGLSWEIGWEQMKGVPAWMQGAGASLLEKAGFEDAARSQRISARNLVTEMYQNIGELESLYSGPHSWAEAQEKGTAGSYAMWGINEAIKQVPNLATMALGALVSGGAMAPALLGRFAIARGMASIPMAAGNAQRGAQIAGVGLTSALLNTGEIYSSALLESGENNPAITGLAGLIAGSLDLWPGSKVIRAMGKDKNLGSFIANKFLADKKWRSRFYRALELGATEGFVEDIQTVIEAATINYLNSNDLSREYVDMAYGFIPITAEQVAERMEARAAGGLLGGLLGFPGRTVTKHAKKEDVKLNEEDMRELNDQLATVTVTVDGQVIGTYQEDFGVAPTYAPTPLTIGARGEGEFGITPERVARPYNAQRQKAALATVLEKYRAAKEKWEANPTDEAYQRDVQPLELEYYAAVMNDNELMFGVEEAISYVTPEKLKTVQEYIQARKAIVAILNENPKLTESLKELRTVYTLNRQLEDALGEEADTAAFTMPYDGGMNPFATTPAANIRGRVTSLDVPPVTRRRLAQWYANKTTQEAAEALEQSYGPEGVPDALAALETAFGPGKQPETRAQRKSRLTKEKKARERETKTLEAERIRAEEQSALMAGLYGGAPSGAAGIPTSVAQPTGPTMTVSYGMEEAAEQTVSEEAKDSPYTVVDVGRGPGTREYDLDQAMLIGMMLDDVRNFKIAEEQSDLVGVQKSLLMKAYLALGEKYGYSDLKKILKGLGLSSKDITNAELGLPKGKPTIAALDEAIKNFIGKDLLFAEDMENAYSEMEMDQIINSEKLLSTLSRAQEGDERALFLLQKYGIPPDEAAIAARESIAAARAEAVRRIERKEAALLKGAAARRTADELVTEEMQGRVAAEKETLGLPPKQILKKKKPVLTGKKLKRAGILRARAMPSEEAGIVLPGEQRKMAPPRELGLAEPVTITYADVEAELKRLAPESDSLIPWTSASTLPISDSEADNYLELEAAYTMIWNAFSVTEKGESIFLPTRIRRMGLRNWVIGPEGIYQNAKKALETLLPKGEDLYSLDYYKQQKFAPESALGKLLGDKTLGDIERDIGRRLAAKRKGVWGEADWETKITDAEIDAEVKKIVAFSPAGTYVLRQQPPRKKMMMFERGKDGNILLFNEDEVFKLDAKGNVVVYDEGGLKVGSYDPSSTIERGEGQPKIVLKELTKTQRTQLPDRLIGYDKNDQLVEEQFVDDERNFKLVARLELLKNKYGLVKDIPMQELGRVASEFSIGSKFVGVVTRRGRATMMSLEALSVVTEDVKGSIWFRVADKERTSQYLMLTDVGTRYQELMKIDGMSTDRAWEMSLSQEIETMQKMANIRYDQIIANNEQLLSNTRNDSGDLTAEEVKEANKELNDILEEEEAIFDAATIEKVIAFANENREFITDADNAKHMPSIPKGKEVQSTQVYNSLRNSASQGKRSFYIGTGIDETEESFMARFSVAPRTPRVITKDTKVTLLPSAWKAIYEKDPFVQTLAKQVLRMKSLLGGKRTTEQENFKKIMLVPLGEEKRWDEGDVVKRYQLVDASERKFESAVELIVERESREGDPRSPTLWSDEDIKTMVEGIGGDLVFKNKKGEWVAPWEIDVKAWRERLERQYWEARHRYYETLNQQDLKTEAQRRRDQVTKLFKERSEAKEVTVSRQKKPANWKTMKKEEQQAWLEKAIQVSMMQDELILLDGFYHYKMMLETAIGNITSATYNVERSVPHIDKSGRAIGYDVITIQSERGPKFNVTEDQVVVVKLSQTALTRIQSNEIWKLQQKAKDVAKKGTINISSKLEKLRQVKVSVQEEINKELDAITEQENKEEITPAKAEKDREKIRGSFTVRVFERLKDVTHDGKPFIALPKDLRKRVAAKELTYKQGVIKYIASIRERFSETRLARVARLQREHLEDEDRLLIASLQTVDGKWRSKKVFEEGSKDYIKGFEEQVLGVSRDLHRPFRPKGIFKPKGWDLYKLLQDRYDDLVATRSARSSVRPERISKLSIKIFEGKKLPAAWRAGRYWEFAKSAEYKDSADAWWTVLEDVYRKETEEVETFTLRKGVTRAVQPFLPAQDFVGPLEARIPKGKEIGIRGGRIIEAAPRMRWKNAYGVIIDKISFRFIPSGSVKEEILTIYEVIDPYLPENNQTFNTLKEATKAFGNVEYYRKLGEVAYPSPEQLGRFPRFPKRNLRPDTKGKAKPPVTNAAPVTTQQVMADNAKGQTVVVTVLSSDSNESKINVTETYQDVVPDVTGPKTRIYKPTEKRTTRKAPSLGVLGGQVVEDVGEVTPEGFAPGKAPKRIVKEGERLVLDPKTGRPMKDPETGMLMRYSFVLTGRYTDGEFPHTLSADENEGGSSRDSVVDRLNEAFGRQIFSLVHVVQSVGDLPLEYQMSAETYDPDIRGVTYNSKIYLVSDNLPMNRIVPVTLHELGAHGMQAVMGKRFYQKLMAQVAVLVNTDPEMGALYDKIKAELGDVSEAIILEEVMAYTVENEAMSDSTFWRAVVDAILYGLARLKLWLNPKWIGASDILIFAKAAARRHFHAVKDGDAKFAANFLNTFLYSGDLGKDRSTESDFGERLTGDLREKTGPGMEAGFRGKWFNIDVPLPEKWWQNFLMIRDVSRVPPAPGKRIRKLGKKHYQIYVAPSVVKWIADYFIILRSLEESIKARGGVITARNMPSLYHGAYKNIVNTRRKNFHRDMVIPFQNFLRDKKVNADDLHLYLYANHAESRNEVHKGKARASGVPVASGLFNTIAEAEAWNRANEKKYRSAEGIFQELLARNGGSVDSQQWRDLEKAAQYIYKINNANLQMQIEEGMLNLDRLDDKQTRAYLHKEYQRTYVPLKGENIVVADEFFEEPLGPGKIGAGGPESKAVHGRVSEAENTWAWSIMQMDYEIDRVEKNKVVKAFARLINENKENFKDEEGRDTFATVVSLSDYKNHRDPFTKRLFLGLVEKQQTDPDHNIHFKSDGVEFVILVTDKRIGQAFNRTNMTDSGVFLQTTSMINRYFSAVHTSINPEFVITNFIRDFQTAMFNLQGVKETTAEFKDAEALGRKVFKDIKNAGVGLRHYIRDEMTDTEWSALAHEFSLEGGRIDFFAFKDVRDFEKKLKDYIKDSTAAGAKRWAKEMIGFIGDYNAVVENTMRLATYKNAKEAFIANGMEEGDAKRRAADIARNLTVNFSQKGEKGAALNSLYLFFNASVQGTVRLFQAMFQRPTGKKGFTRVQKIAGGIMMFSFTQAILNAMLAGDDEDGVNRYRQIDLRSRGRTAHIYLPGFDTFFKIPLPYGYNIFHAIGDTLASLMMGHTNPGRATMHVMSSAAESFMPFSFGSSDNLFRAGLKAASPTFADPLVDLALNESYFGQPIYKDPVWGSSDPPSERYWSSTGTIFKGVSRALNSIGGSKVEPGFVSIPPDVFEYLWESIGGGAARFVERTTDLVWSIGPMPGRITHRETGEVKWNKVPFARRFFYDETATRNRFVYDKYSEYEQAIKAATGLNTGILEVYGKGKHYESFKESEDYELFRLDDYRRRIMARITRYQKDRNKILKNPIMRNDVKEDKINRLNDLMRDERVRLINKVDEIWENEDS